MLNMQTGDYRSIRDKYSKLCFNSVLGSMCNSQLPGYCICCGNVFAINIIFF